MPVTNVTSYRLCIEGDFSEQTFSLAEAEAEVERLSEHAASYGLDNYIVIVPADDSLVWQDGRWMSVEEADGSPS